jgi:CBS domain-containing protein
MSSTEEAIMAATTVREIMTKNVINMQVSTTLEEAARAMREQDIGNVVVAEDERLVGLVTDRDIVIRAVADGMDPTTTTLGSVASRDIIAIQPDDTAQAAALLMREQAIRRVLVVDEQGLCGILSIGDLASEIDPDSVLGGISGAAPNS